MQALGPTVSDHHFSSSRPDSWWQVQVHGAGCVSGAGQVGLPQHGTAAGGAFGDVQGRVGAVQQHRSRRGSPAGDGGQAHRRRHADVDAVSGKRHLDGPVESGEQGCGEGVAVGRRVVGPEYGHLVAAEAVRGAAVGRGVVLGDAGEQGQQLVAAAVAAHSVDLGELVDVDDREQDRPARRMQPGEVGQEDRPGPQSGQRVVGEQVNRAGVPAAQLVVAVQRPGEAGGAGRREDEQADVLQSGHWMPTHPL